MTKRVLYLLATAVFPLLILWATFVPNSSAGGSLVLIDAVYYDGFATNDTDEAVRLTTPVRMSLEEAIAYVDDDELVEVTPKIVRLRKRHLDPHERKRQAKAG